MSVWSRILLVAILVLLTVPFLSRVNAVGGPTITAVYGNTVTINSNFQPGQWTDATHLRFQWAIGNNSSLASPGNIWLKNDGTNLLIAINSTGSTILGTSSNVYTYTLALLFNDKNNGTVNNWDAAKLLTYTTAGNSWTYSDQHYDSSLGHYVPDSSPNGTAAGSFTNYGGSGAWTWEFSIPMSSSNQESFNLTVESTVGFNIMFTETHSLNNGATIINDYSYWPMPYPNGGPTGGKPSANEWASLTRSSSTVADTTPPVIGTPTVQPTAPRPTDNATITVTVTDPDSPVYTVLIYYTIDNWKTTNTTIGASYNATTMQATTQMPQEIGGTHVQYYIVAFDPSGNRAVNNNNGAYYGYTVALSPTANTSAYLVLGLGIAMVLIIGLVIVFRPRPRIALSSE